MSEDENDGRYKEEGICKVGEPEELDRRNDLKEPVGQLGYFGVVRG